MNLYGTKELANSIRTVRRNTILIAEDIPASSYSYRPTPESRSVAEILLHILAVAQASEELHGRRRVTSFANIDLRALLAGLPIKEEQQSSKTEIMDLLRAEEDRWSQWLEQLPESILAEQVTMPNNEVKSRFELLIGVKEHEMHHRGQLMVIERLLGIVPHLTRTRAQTAASGSGRPASN